MQLFARPSASLSLSLLESLESMYRIFRRDDGRYFAAVSCERWRGSHATVEQVGAFSFSSMELRGFAVSAGIGRGWQRKGRPEGKGTSVGARRYTTHPTQR